MVPYDCPAAEPERFGGAEAEGGGPQDPPEREGARRSTGTPKDAHINRHADSRRDLRFRPGLR